MLGINGAGHQAVGTQGARQAMGVPQTPPVSSRISLLIKMNQHGRVAVVIPKQFFNSKLN